MNALDELTDQDYSALDIEDTEPETALDEERLDLSPPDQVFDGKLLIEYSQNVIGVKNSNHATFFGDVLTEENTENTGVVNEPDQAILSDADDEIDKDDSGNDSNFDVQCADERSVTTQSSPTPSVHISECFARPGRKDCSF